MNALVDVGEFEQLARTGKAQAAAKVYRDLEETLRAANAVCFDDLLVLLTQWGPCITPFDCPGDIDADGAVGATDLAMLIAGWGRCAG